jgi:hypothetical protein
MLPMSSPPHLPLLINGQSLSAVDPVRSTDQDSSSRGFWAASSRASASRAKVAASRVAMPTAGRPPKPVNGASTLGVARARKAAKSAASSELRLNVILIVGWCGTVRLTFGKIYNYIVN